MLVAFSVVGNIGGVVYDFQGVCISIAVKKEVFFNQIIYPTLTCRLKTHGDRPTSV